MPLFLNAFTFTAWFLYKSSMFNKMHSHILVCYCWVPFISKLLIGSSNVCSIGTSCHKALTFISHDLFRLVVCLVASLLYRVVIVCLVYVRVCVRVRVLFIFLFLLWTVVCFVCLLCFFLGSSPFPLAFDFSASSLHSFLYLFLSFSATQRIRPSGSEVFSVAAFSRTYRLCF